LKHTPYIYILIILKFSFSIYAQETKTLQIKGLTNIDSILIEQIGYNRKFSQDSVFQKEINVFSLKLEKLGFVESNIISISKSDSTYNIKFDLGTPIKTIRLKHFSFSKTHKSLGHSLFGINSIDVPYSEFKAFMDKLTKYYQDNGYPFISIHLLNITKNKDLLLADIHLEKNEKRKIDKIIVKGYSNFPKPFIKHHFLIYKGSNFNKEKITQISELSKTLSFISEIKKPEILFSKDSTSLYLYFKKKQSNFFDGLIGFSSNPDEKGIKLNGNLNVKIKNALNTGETIELKWLSSQNQTQTLQITTSVPYIFKTAFSLDYSFSIHKQDSAFSKITNLIDTNFSLAPSQKIGFVLENQQSSTLGYNEINKIKGFSSYFYGLSYSFSKPNYHPVFSKKLAIYSQVSQGKRDDTKQFKVINHFLYLISVNNKNNIVLKNTTKILFSDNYLENEMFLIGGSKSIRGFNERSFTANGYTLFTSEYNYLINNTTFLSGMIDIGLLQNKIQSEIITTYSFGVGFSQKIKLGQLGIQYFVGNSNTNPFSINNSKLHFTISRFF